MTHLDFGPIAQELFDRNAGKWQSVRSLNDFFEPHALEIHVGLFSAVARLPCLHQPEEFFEPRRDLAAAGLFGVFESELEPALRRLFHVAQPSQQISETEDLASFGGSLLAKWFSPDAARSYASVAQVAPSAGSEHHHLEPEAGEQRALQEVGQQLLTTALEIRRRPPQRQWPTVALWMSTINCLERRACWKAPHLSELSCSFCSHSSREEWVRSAKLSIHGVESPIFRMPRRSVAVSAGVATESAEEMESAVLDHVPVCAGATLTQAWALIASSTLRQRGLTQKLLQNVKSPLTHQAFARVVQEELLTINASLDEAFATAGRASTLTPLQLWVQAQPLAAQLEELTALSDVDAEQLSSTELLELLFSQCVAGQLAWSEFRLGSDERGQTISLEEGRRRIGERLLECSLEPLLRHLSSWAFQGQPQDPLQEFVKSKQSAPRVDKGRTSRVKAARMDVARLPNFLQTVFADIERSGRLGAMLPSSEQGGSMGGAYDLQLYCQPKARKEFQRNEEPVDSAEFVSGSLARFFGTSSAPLSEWQVQAENNEPIEKVSSLAPDDPGAVEQGLDSDAPLEISVPHNTAGEMVDRIWPLSSFHSQIARMPLEDALQQNVIRPLRTQASYIDGVVGQRLFLEKLHALKIFSVLRRFVLFNESQVLESAMVEVVEGIHRQGSMRGSATAMPLEGEGGRGGISRAVPARGLPQAQSSADPRRGRLSITAASVTWRFNNLFHTLVPRPSDAEEDAVVSSLRFVVSERHVADAAATLIEPQPWDIAGALSLELALPSPIACLFSKAVMLQYSKLFRLILVVHHTLHCLKQAWLVAVKQQHVATQTPTWVLATRHRMHQFVVTLQRFLTVQVVAAEASHLESQMRSSASFTALQSAHSTFLLRCQRKAFLDSSSEAAQQTIIDLLKDVMDFCHLINFLQEDRSRLAMRQASSPVWKQLAKLRAHFLDLSRKLRLTTPDGEVELLRSNEDFLNEWLASWLRRCEC